MNNVQRKCYILILLSEIPLLSSVEKRQNHVHDLNDHLIYLQSRSKNRFRR